MDIVYPQIVPNMTAQRSQKEPKPQSCSTQVVDIYKKGVLSMIYQLWSNTRFKDKM